MVRLVADISAFLNTEATRSMHRESTSQRPCRLYRYSPARKSGSQHGSGADPPGFENNISCCRESMCKESLAWKTGASGWRTFAVVARLPIRGLSGRSSSHCMIVWRAMSNSSFLFVQFGKMTLALIKGLNRTYLYILINEASAARTGVLAIFQNANICEKPNLCRFFVTAIKAERLLAISLWKCFPLGGFAIICCHCSCSLSAKHLGRQGRRFQPPWRRLRSG